MNFNNGIVSLGTDLNLHGRLINTFSLMEYIGARKILKSQSENEVDEILLSHVGEEIRHAKALKHLALKLSEGILVSYHATHLLGDQAAQRYMQQVDHEGAKILDSRDRFKNYLTTTWLIEDRALKVYPEYESVMTHLGFPNQFKMILKDEEKHSQFIRDALEKNSISEKDRQTLIAMEADAFASFCENVFRDAKIRSKITFEPLSPSG